METVKLVAEIKSKISKLKAEGKTIGFVPTMGALHKGHLSLVDTSVKNNDITVVSIFVNPTQFNNPEDLLTYPRTIEEDLEKLSDCKPDLIFIPEVNEIYPEPDTRIFDFGVLDRVMEGKKRPGHFNGVAQVVSKLFDIVSPENAYFGQKDFQQVAVIKQMTKDLKLNVNIVPCPIIREKDGLAMSSRNVLLSEDQRKNACKISETLFKARNLVAELSVSQLKEWVVEEINKNNYLSVEYFEIVNDTTLEVINDWNESNNKIGCITVQVGKTRLIDNVTF
ncbi:pantoate--beta-alanine ligase [Labilibaculum manganireducens]|uniref:Pantothenate synthetase n=1 Tax=Labilibaculum manganireducens TaxID=1940525 RepID=A0A2N3I328_9BACT|nr:pantoate--beta-alanine ligase [Labilibaculum manganireducens]PKQ64663.1 pantoate--beta-alanine ligase [Labilibaculum manganireducens]